MLKITVFIYPVCEFSYLVLEVEPGGATFSGSQGPRNCVLLQGRSQDCRRLGSHSENCDTCWEAGVNVLWGRGHFSGDVEGTIGKSFDEEAEYRLPVRGGLKNAWQPLS